MGLDEYRSLLIEAERAAQESFDKTIISLSSGALGISFVFVSNITTEPIQRPLLLILAWGVWGLSVTLILTSFVTSRFAFQRAVKQVDTEKVHDERPGGLLTVITNMLNIISGMLFIVGVFLLAWFVTVNMGIVSSE